MDHYLFPAHPLKSEERIVGRYVILKNIKGNNLGICDYWTAMESLGKFYLLLCFILLCDLFSFTLDVIKRTSFL